MRLFFIFICFSLFSTASYALNKPLTGQVLLTLFSNYLDNPKQIEKFDMAKLNALPQKSIITHTPWTKGQHTYTGFSAKDLLKSIGSKATLIKVIALNKYTTELPITDFTDYGAIFATHQDGQPISIRKLGPIMMIYPFDSQPTLKTGTYYGRSIWQVYRIKAHFKTE